MFCSVTWLLERASAGLRSQQQSVRGEGHLLLQDIPAYSLDLQTTSQHLQPHFSSPQTTDLPIIGCGIADPLLNLFEPENPFSVKLSPNCALQNEIIYVYHVAYGLVSSVSLLSVHYLPGLVLTMTPHRTVWLCMMSQNVTLVFLNPLDCWEPSPYCCHPQNRASLSLSRKTSIWGVGSKC